MRKYLTLIAVVIAVWTYGRNGLLWKVTGPGLSQPSYILGSHHLAPKSFVDSIYGLHEVLGEVYAVYGEVAQTDLMSSETLGKTMQMAMAPADSTLSSVLSPAELMRVDSIIEVYTGQKGMTRLFDRLKPSMLSTQISLWQLSAAFPQLQGSRPFDVEVMSIGASAGKPVGGLESADEQLELLYGESIKRQAEELMQIVNDNDSQCEMIRKITESYLRQDLDSVNEIFFAQLHDEADSERMIYARNRRWADALEVLMPQHPLLVVVGCGHLGSDLGLLQLLRDKGYNIEPY